MTSLPLVAVVGRPNVGKSTLVNRIAQIQQAIVHEEAGVTRDRNYVQADWAGRDFTLIDTGGLDFGAKVSMQAAIHRQAMIAAEEADVILFVVEGPAGPMPGDEEIADVLRRRTDKAVVVVTNKVDDPADESARHVFYQLGLGEPMLVSALHGTGTGDLLDEVIACLPAEEVPGEQPEETGRALSIAVVGRPNAGKSSLVNRLVGAERSLVAEAAGTTRDSVDSLVRIKGETYRFIDTAGLRRKSKVQDAVEYYGFVRALRWLDRADIALVVIDATVGVGDADQKVAEYAKSRGCATIVLINKRDVLAGDQLNELTEDVRDKLRFISYSPTLGISAKTGQGVNRLPGAIERVAAQYESRIATGRLNAFLADLRHAGNIPSKAGRALKLKYATQIRTAPPAFTFFVTAPRLVDAGFRRYLENRLREAFGFEGTPISLEFRSAK